MKKYIILFWLIIVIQPMSFAIGTKSTMEKVMGSWNGENINTVINYWGYPTSEQTIAGRRLYHWLDSSYTVSGNQYGVYGGESTCNRTFEVDKNNNIIKWQWTGNSCPATYFTSKKWVNPNSNPWRSNKSRL